METSDYGTIDHLTDGTDASSSPKSDSLHQNEAMVELSSEVHQQQTTMKTWKTSTIRRKKGRKLTSKKELCPENGNNDEPIDGGMDHNEDNENNNEPKISLKNSFAKSRPSPNSTSEDNESPSLLKSLNSPKSEPNKSFRLFQDEEEYSNTSNPKKHPLSQSFFQSLQSPENPIIESSISPNPSNQKSPDDEIDRVNQPLLDYDQPQISHPSNKDFQSELNRLLGWLQSADLQLTDYQQQMSKIDQLDTGKLLSFVESLLYFQQEKTRQELSFHSLETCIRAVNIHETPLKDTLSEEETDIDAQTVYDDWHKSLSHWKRVDARLGDLCEITFNNIYFSGHVDNFIEDTLEWLKNHPKEDQSNLPLKEHRDIVLKNFRWRKIVHTMLQVPLKEREREWFLEKREELRQNFDDLKRNKHKRNKPYKDEYEKECEEYEEISTSEINSSYSNELLSRLIRSQKSKNDVDTNNDSLDDNIEESDGLGADSDNEEEIDYDNNDSGFDIDVIVPRRIYSQRTGHKKVTKNPSQNLFEDDGADEISDDTLEEDELNDKHNPVQAKRPITSITVNGFEPGPSNLEPIEESSGLEDDDNSLHFQMSNPCNAKALEDQITDSNSTIGLDEINFESKPTVLTGDNEEDDNSVIISKSNRSKDLLRRRVKFSNSQFENPVNKEYQKTPKKQIKTAIVSSNNHSSNIQSSNHTCSYQDHHSLNKQNFLPWEDNTKTSENNVEEDRMKTLQGSRSCCSACNRRFCHGWRLCCLFCGPLLFFLLLFFVLLFFVLFPICENTCVIRREYFTILRSRKMPPPI